MGKRLFIAVSFGPDVAGRCAEVCSELRGVSGPARVSWVPPGNIHLTLKFLGTRPESEIPGLEAVLRRIASVHTSRTLEVRGLGAFPQEGRVNVIWADVIDPEKFLTLIAAQLEQELAALGFASEEKRFVPHLTLGRVKHGSFPREALEKHRDMLFGDAEISELVLFESDTRPEGAIYHALSRIPLRR